MSKFQVRRKFKNYLLSHKSDQSPNKHSNKMKICFKASSMLKFHSPISSLTLPPNQSNYPSCSLWSVRTTARTKRSCKQSSALRKSPSDAIKKSAALNLSFRKLSLP